MPVSNLSHPSTRFIGRSSELLALDAALRSSPLVTLVGPPGAGKTRLAQEFARHGERLAWFCDLSECKTQEDVCITVSQVLGVSLSTVNPIQQLRLILAARTHELFLLDNCEQLSELGPLLQTWLSPGLLFVATSRSKLSIAEETLLLVGPLSLPSEDTAASDSVALFVDRARMVRYEYHPSTEDLEAISSLVIQLDGLPLAIELAASRMKLLTPTQIEKNLSRRFLLLSRDDTDNLRHAKLRSAIEWSWELLTRDEQSALAQCSLFRGGFSLEAAEAIILLEETPVIDALQSLLDKSLLYRTEAAAFPTESRFFLYISVREYAQETLREEGALFARYVHYFLRVGFGWRLDVERHDRHSSRARIELERDNLLAVSRGVTEPEQRLRAALSLSPLLAVKGPFQLRESLLASALESGEGPAVLRAAALHQRGIALQSLGKTSDALQSFESALQLVSELSEPAFEARILGSIAEHLTRAGKLIEAEEHFERALQKNRTSDDALWEGSLLNNLGLLRDAQLDPAAGQEAFAKALQIYQRLGCADMEALAIGNLASLLAVQGELLRAKELLERSLLHYQTKEDFAPKALAFANLGLIEQELGNFHQAIASFTRAIRILQRIGYRTHEAIIGAAGLGLCYQEMGAATDALVSYRRSLEIYQEFKNPIQEGLAHSFMGSLFASESKIEEARRSIGLAKERLKSVPLHLVILSLSEAFLLLQEQQEHFTKEEFQEAESKREEVRQRMNASKEHQQKSTYVRTLLRMLQRKLDAIVSWRESLFVAEDGSWFSCLGGPKVSLQRRRALPQILQRLAQKRLSSANEAVALSALVEAGWPNERLVEQAAYNRLYVAISTLRSLGLREMLISREDGWLLQAETPLYLVAASKK